MVSSPTLTAVSSDNPADLLQLWMEHSTSAIAFFDRQMRYVMANHNWIEDYGLARQDIIGRSHYEVFPEIGEDWKAIHQRCLQGATEQRAEDPFLRIDGTFDWLKWDVHPWHQPDGEIGGIVMVTEIITEQKQTEHSLLDAQAALEAKMDAEVEKRTSDINEFFNLAADMLAITGFDGYFKRINPMFSRVLGYSTSELKAAPFLSFVHPDDEASTLAAASKLAAGGDVIAFENRYRCRDGSYRWLSWTVYSSPERGLSYANARDVTEQKATAVALRRQAQLLEQVKGSIVSTDLVGRITSWSQGATDLYRYTSAEAIGQPISLLYPEALHDYLDQEIIAPLQRQGQLETETRNCDRTGREFDVLLSLSLERDEADRAVGMILYTLDISDRKQAQHRLEQEQSFLKALLDNLADGIVACDRNGMLTLFNRATREFHGISEAQLPPEQWASRFDLYHGDGQTLMEVTDIPLFRAFNGEQVCNAEIVVVPKQGTLRNLLASGQAFFDEAGEKQGAVVVLRDITSRKQAEIQLQAYADRQALLNQVTNQIRSSLNLETIIDNTLTAIQQRLQLDYCAFAWYRPDLETPAWDIIQEARMPHLDSAIGPLPMAQVGPIEQPLLSTGLLKIDQVEHYEEPVHRAFLQQVQLQSELIVLIRTQAQSDRIGIISCTSQAEHLWSDGEVELITAVGDQLAIAIEQADLYHQSQQRSQALEQALRELQQTQVKMIQAEKMSSLGQLVAGVAHEINNPVNFIFGNLGHAQTYADSLLQMVQLYQAQFPSPGDVIEQAREDLDLEFVAEDLPKLLASMKLGTERIRAIVSSLRVFSRMDESDMKSVDIHEGIDSTLMILHNRLKSQHDRPDIVVQRQFGDLPQIGCYAGQLNQVFMNIISNAIDALEDAWKRQRISEPVITIRSRINPQGQVEIAISDNGLGIPEAVQDRIFNPFFTTKPVGKGTGMGLSISYQIIAEKHGGTLVCHSNPTTGGTEFIITIPQHQPEPKK